MSSKKSIIVWVGVNKNGKISLHTEEPYRNGDRWESKSPFCNSVVYKQFTNLLSKSELTWENECEIIELTY